MKKNILIFLFLIVVPFMVVAQSVPEGFNYQAVVRDAAGNIRKNATVELKFALLPSQFANKAAWAETHTVKTDGFGTCSLVIGSGKRISGTAAAFGEVDFSASSYWLKVELKDNGQYIALGGAQKLLSVPYARVAGKVAAEVPAMPAGTIMAFAGNTDKIPAGWLLCDGAVVPRSNYQTLYNTIGTNWGVGDNATTFNLPDFRGMFLRGVSGGSGKDPDAAARTSSTDNIGNSKGGNIGNNVGSYQSDALKSHDHAYYDLFHNPRKVGNGDNLSVSDNSTTYEERRTDAAGGNETRPLNAYVHYIIKF